MTTKIQRPRVPIPPKQTICPTPTTKITSTDKMSQPEESITDAPLHTSNNENNGEDNASEISEISNLSELDDLVYELPAPYNPRLLKLITPPTPDPQQIPPFPSISEIFTFIDIIAITIVITRILALGHHELWFFATAILEQVTDFWLGKGWMGKLANENAAKALVGLQPEKDVWRSKIFSIVAVVVIAWILVFGGHERWIFALAVLEEIGRMWLGEGWIMGCVKIWIVECMEGSMNELKKERHETMEMYENSLKAEIQQSTNNWWILELFFVIAIVVGVWIVVIDLPDKGEIFHIMRAVFGEAFGWGMRKEGVKRWRRRWREWVVEEWRVVKDAGWVEVCMDEWRVIKDAWMEGWRRF